MAEKLQSLLDKINEKGVKEAEAAAAEIIAKAKQEAEAIRTKAKADADAAVRRAGEEAEDLEKRAAAAIRQAARDILLELQQELETRMTRAVSSAAGQALTPEFMASLVKELAAKFADNPDGRITILAAGKDLPALEQALKASLVDGFRNAPQLFADSGIKSGFEVSFRDGDLYFDFTSEAVTELVAEYIGPRLAAILKGE